MAYLPASGVWDDTKEFVGNISKTVRNVKDITGKAAKEGKITTEVKLPLYLKAVLFGGLGLAAYYILLKRKG